MTGVRALLARFDAYQQSHAPLGFPLAVAKKFGEDSAGNLAAVIAWSAMLAVFPLLLLLITILGIVLRNDPSLQHRILKSALVEFPVIGQQLQTNIKSLNRSGVGLVVGIIGTFLGTRGVANALQNALNTLWGVPRERQPGFPWNALRSLAIVLVLGIGLIVTATLSGFGGGTGAIGAGLRIAAIAVAFALNVVVFSVVFRLAIVDVAWKHLWLGAFLTALGWEVLLTVGGYLIAHDVKNMSAVYGTFALVLGLMSWLYLQAEITLYAVEIDVVRVQRRWPRAIRSPKRTASLAASTT
jgi:YihY family inner membrane protein